MRIIKKEKTRIGGLMVKLIDNDKSNTIYYSIGEENIINGLCAKFLEGYDIISGPWLIERGGTDRYTRKALRELEDFCNTYNINDIS